MRGLAEPKKIVMDGNKVLSTAAFGLAAENIIECLWTRESVKIDGIAQDWDDATPITDPGSKAQYALKSDNRNLYIITVFRDQMSRTTFDYTGMKIYFTTGAKKSKAFGINFQKKQYTAEALIANMEKRGQALTEEQKAEIRKKPNHVVFTKEAIKPKKAVIEIDPAVTVEPPIFWTIEKGQLSVCEFRIPLQPFIFLRILRQRMLTFS